jgi:hypothetical protein
MPLYRLLDALISTARGQSVLYVRCTRSSEGYAAQHVQPSISSVLAV